MVESLSFGTNIGIAGSWGILVSIILTNHHTNFLNDIFVDASKYKTCMYMLIGCDIILCCMNAVYNKEVRVNVSLFSVFMSLNDKN